MTGFLEKHFNRCLADSEREEILNDFPKPNTPVLNAPKLDEDMVDQLKSKGKDPHFGQERVLFKLQEALLDVSGPLMCLWADLTNPRAEVSRKETVLFTQRALVLLGSASNAINLERRKIAWARINPNLKALATESYEKREDQIFGPGFLEKASKKIETQKALAKVSSEQTSRKRTWDNDKSNLRSFFYQKAPLRSTAAGTSASTSRTASHTTIASSSSNSQETNPPAANLNPSPANKSHTAIFKHSFTSITNRRQSCPLFAELEADYLRSLDARSSERLPPGIFQPPIPGIPSPHCGQVTLRAAADRGGDTSPTPEAGSGQDQPQPRPVCEQSIPGHKERWLLPPSDQSEATELLPSEATFQDGGNWDAERSPTSVRLDVLKTPTYQ